MSTQTTVPITVGELLARAELELAATAGHRAVQTTPPGADRQLEPRVRIRDQLIDGYFCHHAPQYFASSSAITRYIPSASGASRSRARKPGSLKIRLMRASALRCAPVELSGATRTKNR